MAPKEAGSYPPRGVNGRQWAVVGVVRDHRAEKTARKGLNRGQALQAGSARQACQRRQDDLDATQLTRWPSRILFR